MKEIIEKIQNSQNYLIFSVGDSLTEGRRSSGPEFTYTAVFTREIAARFSDRTVIRIDGKRVENRIDRFNRVVVQEKPEENGKITVVRSGYGGNTVQRLINRKDDFIGHSFENTEADLFMISVGINDSVHWDADKYVTPAQYQENLRALLKLIRQTHPNADVILITPTWYAEGDEGKDMVAPYAAAMLAMAAEDGVPCLDMHKLWQEHHVPGERNFGHGDWLYDDDRCHPGDIGHAAFAAALIRFLFDDEV